MIDISASTAHDSETGCYRGTVFYMKRPAQAEILWTCTDEHADERGALACGEAERDRRLKEHAETERAPLSVADLTVGWDHITDPAITISPYYTGQLAVVPADGPPDVIWACVHQHATENAASQCASWERESMAREGSRYIVSIPAAELLKVLDEALEWARCQSGKGDVTAAHFFGGLSLGAEIVKRWPDRNWRGYFSTIQPELTEEDIAKSEAFFAHPGTVDEAIEEIYGQHGVHYGRLGPVGEAAAAVCGIESPDPDDNIVGPESSLMVSEGIPGLAADEPDATALMDGPSAEDQAASAAVQDTAGEA